MVTTFALSRRALALIVAAILFVAALLPALITRPVSAGQITGRKATISSSRATATGVSWEFDFTFPQTAVTQGILFEFCTTPLGACTKPTGLDVSTGTANVSATQTFSEATAFTEVTASTGDCNIAGTNADTKFCVIRTDADAETATAKELTITSVTNPSLPGQANSYSTVYVRISFYNNNTFDGTGSNVVHTGTVAAAITQQLTTSGRVQERLAFCVAAIDDDDVLPTDCAAMPTTTSIDIGIIDDSAINISPVEPNVTNGANDHYGVAMVNTNASGGVVVTYYPESDTSAGSTNQLRSFRVASATCQALATSIVDQCFVSAAQAGEDFTAGTERFGLHIPCVDTTQGSTTNVTVAAPYDNDDGVTTSVADCESTAVDTGDDFAWRDDGVAETIASSATVVDDEIIKLRFGATASPTTPTGQYRVTTTYIATPTF